MRFQSDRCALPCRAWLGYLSSCGGIAAEVDRTGVEDAGLMNYIVDEKYSGTLREVSWLASLAPLMPQTQQRRLWRKSKRPWLPV